MNDIEREFLGYFRGYLADRTSLRDVVTYVGNIRKFSDAHGCLLRFFENDGEYASKRTKAAPVFHALARRAIELGDRYYPLRAASLIRRQRTPWNVNYAALSAEDKRSLNKLIAQKKLALSRAQREFVETFDRYMQKKATNQAVTRGVTRESRFEARRDLLLAYVEASEAYEERNGNDSALIFLVLSRLTLQADDVLADFVYQYRANIAQAGSPWRERFEGLKEEGHRKAIQEDIDNAIRRRGNVTFNPDTTEARPEERRAAAPLSGDQKQYVRHCRDYVANGDRKALSKIHELQRKHIKNAPPYVDAFLRELGGSKQAPKNPRLLELFFGTVAWAVANSDAYYAFKVVFWIDTLGTIWHELFVALDPKQYGEPLRKRLRDAYAGLRLIDEFKCSYFSQHQKDPNDKALRDFDPPGNVDQDERLAKVLVDFDVAMRSASVELFGKAFDALSGVFTSQPDRLTLMRLVRRSRRQEKLDARLRHLVYFYGVGLLVGAAMRARPVLYQRGIPGDDERAWLLQDTNTHDRYFGEWALIVENAIRARTGAPALAAMCKAQGSLHVHAERLRLGLTPLLAAGALRGAVEKLWEEKFEETARVGVTVGSKTVRVGQTIGKFYVLWWDGRVAYLMVEGFDHTVFEASLSRLHDIVKDDGFYGEIYRNTKDLLVLIPLIFDILTYMPDLVSGGLLGLAKSIAFDFAFDASIQALGVDPTKAQVLLMGLGLLAGGSRPRERGKLDTDIPATHATGTGPDHRLTGGRGNEGALQGAPPNPSRTQAVADAPRAPPAPAVQTYNVSNPSRVPPPSPGRTHGDSPNTPPREPRAPGDRAHSAPGTTEPPTGSSNDIDMRGIVQKDGSIRIRGVDERGSARITVDPPPLKADKGIKNAGIDATGVPSGSKQKKQSTGTPPKKPDPPAPPPPPPSMPPPPSSRINEGTWTKEGNLDVNEGGFRLQGGRPQPGEKPHVTQQRADKVRQAREYGHEYELAVNREILKPMAAKMNSLYDQALKFLVPGSKGAGIPAQKGYRSRSSTKTTRFKFQQWLKKVFADSRFTRRPDAAAEVMSKPKVVGEVQFYEVTANPHFTIGGHKRDQIGETALIASAFEKAGYNRNTPILYNVVCPRKPEPETIAYLNKLMSEMPNLRVSWFVVP